MAPTFRSHILIQMLSSDMFIHNAVTIFLINLMTDIGFAIKCPLRNEKKKKQNIQQESTPPLSKIRSAGIIRIWQKETTSSHI